MKTGGLHLRNALELINSVLSFGMQCNFNGFKLLMKETSLTAATELFQKFSDKEQKLMLY